MILPEELFQTVVENLATFDIQLIEQQFTQLRWKYATAQLVPLSLVNRQLLRRICFPFIFAYVQIHTGELKCFKYKCTTNQNFAMSIRYVCVL
jgi:hypothetical protein